MSEFKFYEGNISGEPINDSNDFPEAFVPSHFIEEGFNNDNTSYEVQKSNGEETLFSILLEMINRQNVPFGIRPIIRESILLANEGVLLKKGNIITLELEKEPYFIVKKSGKEALSNIS